MLIASVFLIGSISPAIAQDRSRDRDNPTPIEKGTKDELDGSDDEYFYQFSVGPGRLSVVLEVTASGTNAGATLDLFDGNSRLILSNVLAQGVDGGTERVVKSMQFAKRQNIIMRIKGIRYGDSGGTGVYTVALEGSALLEGDKAVAPAGDSAAKPAGSNLLTGELDGTESQSSHTLSITGPGRVTLIFDVKASGTNAGAYFDLLAGNGKPILSNILVQGVDSGSERVSKSVKFAKPQAVSIRVTGIRYGSSGGQGVYSVQVEGPVAPVSPD
jgi:hypothetical protein